MKTKMKTKTYDVTRIYSMLVLVFMLTGFLAAGVVENKDKPAKGDYVFPLEKVWQVDSAGETPFSNIVSVITTDSGDVFCRDLKNKEFYIIDKDGKYKGVFGTKGEGPGEVKNTGGAGLSVVGNTVIIQDSDKFLYFGNQGKFLRSVVNNGNSRPASLFLTLDEFISAPANITAVPGGSAKMRYINLKTGNEKIITDFSVFKGGFIQQGQSRAVAVIPTLTPVLVVGQLGGKLYYGMNDKYSLYITDLEGKDLGGFKLQRERKGVTLKEKEDVMLGLIKGYAPDSMARQLAKALPEKETYFSNIDSHGGLLYVYRSHFVAGNHQQIDIFSPEGAYLYRAFIRVQEGVIINAGPTFKNNSVYLALESEDGEITVNKYRTTLPH
ncbi:MAG: hypothetical protein GY940_10130 [bacterium]|nr:hypothetical protein [bacterium]